jgi:hypothetical protein
MHPFFSKLFKLNSKSTKESQEFFNNIKTISELSSDITDKQRQLYDKEYELLMNSADDTYISLRDFLTLMDIENLTIKDIIAKCKHRSEINSSSSSSVIMHSIIEDGHIVLCKDTTNCDKHKDQITSKIKITTIRLID